ncbi:hypothetical protein Ahy_A05g023935 [Arachis hypogaea]|uniref:Putative plant transposon protein domain-containing protein n=1 Tax=Arachis hypogaea TaxID=3818 RepID=A0A445D4W9_ARAHY|nr:hypothetical protein Ahy_A05g023935 [Arachis hypogaea]
MVTTNDKETEDKPSNLSEQPEDTIVEKEKTHHQEPETSQQELLRLYAPFPQLLKGAVGKRIYSRERTGALRRLIGQVNRNGSALYEEMHTPDWERDAGNKPKFIKRTDLTPEAKGWFELVRRSILPAANNSEVNLERATMVHCILKGGEIRVHEIIAQGIRKMAEKGDARGTLGYPSTIYGICKKAGVEFEDEDPVWIKEGIPITIRRMNAAASPIPQKKQRKSTGPQVVEGQAPEGQAPQTLDMHQLREAIDGLSRQYLEGQGAQKELQLQMIRQQEEALSRWITQQGEWQRQMMEQQQSQGQQWGETFNRMEQRQNEQQESIQRLINIQAHQGAHIHEMHRRQIEHTELLDEQRAFAEGVYMSETVHHISTQARLGYLVGQLPILHPGISRYEEMKEELAREERQRVEESHESVRKALADWKEVRLARLRGSARGHKEDQQGKEQGRPQK